MAGKIELKINIQTYAITVVGIKIECLKNIELKFAISNTSNLPKQQPRKVKKAISH